MRSPIPAILVLAAFATSVAADDMVLTKQVGPVDVKLFLPGSAKEIKGLVVHAANYGLKTDDRWAELCRQLDWGHVAMNIPNVQKATNRGAALNAAIDEGLKEFAQKSGHPELVNVPMAGTGHSAGGLVTNILFKRPERALAYTIDCGWVVDPAKLQGNTGQIPALFTIGSIPDAFKMLPSIDNNYFPARKAGNPWGFGLQWGCAHDFGNAATLQIPWIRSIARLRIPADASAKNGVIPLRDVKLEDGWLGDYSTIKGLSPTIAPWAEYKGDKAAAVWLPDCYVAHVWQAWQAKFPPVILEASGPEGKLGVFNPKKSRSLTVSPGDDITLSISLAKDDGSSGTVKKVEYFDGDNDLGRGETFVWKSPRPGTYAVYARYELADGRTGSTHPALVIVRSAKKS